MRRSTTIVIVAATAFMLFVPWLGVTDFYSKGEPREAIVAVSMLQSGNYILPTSYGMDIPYKPPLLAWLIAAFSWLLNGGVVNEFTSRLPSALAAIALLVAGWKMVANRRGNAEAWMTMLVTATSFEFFRAAEACRVDMLLTMFMVGAVYAMFTMKGRPWRYVWATLLLSGAVLTKGPVGSLLPCLAMGIYFLLRGNNFWKTLFTLTVMCLCSFILPLLWYYAAYQQGGEQFYAMAWEENIGRLTGTMTYDSHVNPWWYNFTSIAAGMLPWTVLILLSLFYRNVRQSLKNLKPDRGFGLMSWTVALTVLLFYCLPESKRSVYLLPCYPFMAYGASWLLLKVSRTKPVRVWTLILSIASIAAPCIFVAGLYGKLPKVVFAQPQWWQWAFIAAPAVFSIWWLFTRKINGTSIKSTIMLTYLLLVCYNAAFMPMVLNPRSDRMAAEALEKKTGKGAEIVSVIKQDRLLRYYGMNFYLGDRLRHVTDVSEVPENAWLITEPSDSITGDTLTNRSADTRRAVILWHKVSK